MWGRNWGRAAAELPAVLLPRTRGCFEEAPCVVSVVGAVVSCLTDSSTDIKEGKKGETRMRARISSLSPVGPQLPSHPDGREPVSLSGVRQQWRRCLGHSCCSRSPTFCCSHNEMPWDFNFLFTYFLAPSFLALRPRDEKLVQGRECFPGAERWVAKKLS